MLAFQLGLLPLIILIAVIVLIARGIKIVPQQHAWVLERLGRYHATLTPGLSIVIPFVDRVAYKHMLKESLQAMQAQRTAERERRALIAASEGKRQEQINLATGAREAAIQKSEGERQAAINRAQGEASAILAVAEANAQAIQKVGNAI